MLNNGKKEGLRGESTLQRGHFGHFHDMYIMYISKKCVAFNFGFRFDILIFTKLMISNII